MLRGVVFDFDGVIADTESLHLRAYQEALAGTGLTLMRDAYYTRYLGFDDVGVFTTLGADQGRALEDAAVRSLIARKGEIFDSLVGTTNVLFPGAATCITRLAEEVPLAVASGALRAEIEAILTRANLRQHFHAIVAADDVERSKPAPDTYCRAVELLAGEQGPEIAGRFVAIEDSRWGIDSAKEAGLACIAVTHSYPAEALTAADVVVDSLDDILRPLLEKLCRPLDASSHRVP